MGGNLTELPEDNEAAARNLLAGIYADKSHGVREGIPEQNGPQPTAFYYAGNPVTHADACYGGELANCDPIAYEEFCLAVRKHQYESQRARMQLQLMIFMDLPANASRRTGYVESDNYIENNNCITDTGNMTVPFNTSSASQAPREKTRPGAQLKGPV